MSRQRVGIFVDLEKLQWRLLAIGVLFLIAYAVVQVGEALAWWT